MKIASIQQKKVKRNQSATVCVLTEEGDSYELLYETLVKFGIYDGSDLDEKNGTAFNFGITHVVPRPMRCVGSVFAREVAKKFQIVCTAKDIMMKP